MAKLSVLPLEVDIYSITAPYWGTWLCSGLLDHPFEMGPGRNGHLFFNTLREGQNTQKRIFLDWRTSIAIESPFKSNFLYHLVHDSGLSQYLWKSWICLTIKEIWWVREDSEDPEFCTMKYWIGTHKNKSANCTCSLWNSGIFQRFCFTSHFHLT